jgi:hypothetical protein
MGNAEANGQKILIDTTIGIEWGPTCHILKQTDGSNAAIGAEVEPMPGAPRDTNQIAGFDFDGD